MPAPPPVLVIALSIEILRRAVTPSGLRMITHHHRHHKEQDIILLLLLLTITTIRAPRLRHHLMGLHITRRLNPVINTVSYI